LLTTLGMGEAFEESADLSGSRRRLKHKQVKHKKYVDVNSGDGSGGGTSIGVRSFDESGEKRVLYGREPSLFLCESWKPDE